MSDREAYLGALAGETGAELPPPTTRSLKWMAKALGQDIATEPVQSAEEAYWARIVENGGGGGNPNSMQLITGTLANPWGDFDISNLITAGYFDFYNWTVHITFRFMGVNAFINSYEYDGNLVGQTGFLNYYSNGAIVGCVAWNVDTGDCVICKFGETAEEDPTAFGVTDLINFAPNIVTNTYIIHHPLPETEEEETT